MKKQFIMIAALALVMLTTNVNNMWADDDPIPFWILHPEREMLSGYIVYHTAQFYTTGEWGNNGGCRY